VASANSRTNPLRLPKDREEFDKQCRDKNRSELGISSTEFADEEATIVISTSIAGGHHMDVEYAMVLHKLLGQAITSSKNHNRSLRK
jgi:hypothetical protein